MLPSQADLFPASKPGESFFLFLFSEEFIFKKNKVLSMGPKQVFLK